VTTADFGQLWRIGQGMFYDRWLPPRTSISGRIGHNTGGAVAGASIPPMKPGPIMDILHFWHATRGEPEL
jgi:hypothetical protein